MLAVVDHEEHIAFGEPGGERIFVRLATRPRQPELDGHFGRDELGGPHGGEPDDGHAVGKVPVHAAATVIASAVLPDPSRPDQRRHRRRRDALDHVADLAVPTDEPTRT